MFWVGKSDVRYEMDILERSKMNHEMNLMKTDATNRTLLSKFLKYEIQSMVRRLSEIGEESIVITANVVDGTHSVLSSENGENFLHSKMVAHFLSHFIRYLFTDDTAFLDTDDDSINEHEGFDIQNDKCSTSKLDKDYSPPETFMHMKKHQIEQYNRLKDNEDKAINEEVSKLVKNILKEGKQKEKMRYTSLPYRRKRNSLCQSGSRSHHFESESQKKRKISNLFPTLTPLLAKTPAHESFESQSEHSESDRTNADFIVIKSEPIGDGDDYYGVVTNVTTINNSPDQDAKKPDSQNADSLNIELDESSVCSLSKNPVNTGSVRSKTKGVNKSLNGNTDSLVSHIQSENESSIITDTSNGSHSHASDVNDIKTEPEENLVLPFVEPFFKDREKCIKDVKLTPQEMGLKVEPESSPKPVSCYKPSKKKSNIYNLILNGYSYIRDKHGNGGTIYWKCGRSGCKGRVIQRNQELIVSQSHTHAVIQS